MAMWEVINERLYVKDPETGHKSDEAKKDKPFDDLNFWLPVYGYEKITYDSLPEKVVLLDRDGQFFKKNGEYIENREGKKIACRIGDLHFSFLTDDWDEIRLGSILRRLKGLLYNIRNAPEDLEIYRLVGKERSYKLIETNKGIFVNRYLVDSEHLKLLQSPILDKVEFFEFPLFVSTSEGKVFEYEFIDALESGHKVYVYLGSRKKKPLVLRRITYTGIKLNGTIPDMSKKVIDPVYFVYLIE